MTIEEYKRVVALRREAAEAQKPWLAVAEEIAREKTDLPFDGCILEESRVVYLFSGTGIYRDDQYAESFPVEELVARMAQKR